MKLKESKYYEMASNLAGRAEDHQDRASGQTYAGMAQAAATLALAEQMERIADRLDEMVRFQAGV